MILTLTRTRWSEKAVIGDLSIDGAPECNTLEDNPPIPAGTYEVAVTFSNRFQVMMPILLDVPGRTGIRIHSGNTDKDTTGCILVGTASDGKDNWLSNSRVAYAEVCYKISKAVKGANVWITITD